MKKQLWIFAVLIFSVVLTGCNAASAAELAPQVLDRTNWTQQQTAAPTPTPTPFPKITIADVVTATAPNASVVEATASPTPTPQPVIIATPNLTPVVKPDGATQNTSRTAKGIIVFQTATSGGDVMLINADGSGLRRLTNGIDPVFSPDGQTIAFVRWQGDSGSLWTIGVDGSNERQITGEIKQARHPSWSPDGERIVVNLQHGGRLTEQKECYSLVGTTPEAILKSHLPWNVSPDDVFVEKRGAPPKVMPFLCWNNPPAPYWGLRVVNVADGSIEDFAASAYNYGTEWDPANNWRIISSSANGLAQLDVNRNEQWALTNRREDRTPAFSPDGKYIAVAYNNNGHWDIHRLDAGGNGRVQLTQTPLWVATSVGDGRPWNNVAPAWSPDGTQIAFLTDRTGRWEIWVMNADGSNPQPMFSDAVNNSLRMTYNFVDERALSWQ